MKSISLVITLAASLVTFNATASVQSVAESAQPSVKMNAEIATLYMNKFVESYAVCRIATKLHGVNAWVDANGACVNFLDQSEYESIVTLHTALDAYVSSGKADGKVDSFLVMGYLPMFNEFKLVRKQVVSQVCSHSEYSEAEFC